MDKKLKDLKDEVLVVTNAAEGNTPHVVEDIEPEGGLKTRPLAGAKPSDQFMRIDRNVSILETFFLNMKRQFERPSDFRFYHLPADLLASAKELVGRAYDAGVDFFIAYISCYNFLSFYSSRLAFLFAKFAIFTNANFHFSSNIYFYKTLAFLSSNVILYLKINRAHGAIY